MVVTHASGLALHVFRGPTGADAPTTIRSTVTTDATLSYRAASSPPSVSNLSGSSWVVAHACASAASAASVAVPPTPLVNRDVSAAPFAAVAHDSNGGVTSDWVAQTVAVSAFDANGNRTEVFEVKNAGTLIGAAAYSSGAVDGTIVFPLPAGAQAGDMLALTAYNQGNGTAPVFPAGMTSFAIASSSFPQPETAFEGVWKILVAADLARFVMISDVMP